MQCHAQLVLIKNRPLDLYRPTPPRAVLNIISPVLNELPTVRSYVAFSVCVVALYKSMKALKYLSLGINAQLHVLYASTSGKLMCL